MFAGKIEKEVLSASTKFSNVINNSGGSSEEGMSRASKFCTRNGGKWCQATKTALGWWRDDRNGFAEV